MNRKNTALITGASGGIGLEFAKLFAADGNDLVLVARNAAKLQEIANSLHSQFKIAAHIVPLNLADPKSSEELFQQLQRANIQVDYLVNNAGFGTHGYFHEIDLNENLDLLQLNITTLTHLSRLFAKEMVERKFGGIINIASTAAFQPGPLMATYYASKSYVVAFTEAIAEELKKFNIKVSVICPGPTETNFQQRAGITDALVGKKSILMMESEKVARIGYKNWKCGKTVIITGVMNTMGAKIAKVTPHKITNSIIKSMHKK